MECGGRHVLCIVSKGANNEIITPIAPLEKCLDFAEARTWQSLCLSRLGICVALKF